MMSAPAPAAAQPMLALINLDVAAERRARMTARLAAAGLQAERIGVDLRIGAADRIRRAVDAALPGFSFDLDVLSGAEVGCWLSHACAWQRMLERPSAAACTVIEDDLVLAPHFAEAVTELSAQTHYDLVFLGTSSKNLSMRRRRRIGPFVVHEPLGPVYNTWGYTITRRWVQRLMNDGPRRIAMPIDHFLGGRAGHGRPRIAVLKPAAVSEDEQLGRASQIAPYTRRIDRWPLLENARRRLLASRISDWYYAMYRLR